MPEANPFDRFDPLPVSPLAKVAPPALAMIPGGFHVWPPRSRALGLDKAVLSLTT